MEELPTLASAFKAAGPRPPLDSSQGDKKNYAERLSRSLSTVLANGLRPWFEGITPDPDGTRQEQPARTSKGVKKLDVNYSKPEIGLGLGVSIKTLNYRDPRSKRYTKNYSRIDNELRAEAKDYHERQPYSVLVAVIFLPVEACDDGSKSSESSFGAAVQYYRHRTGRRIPRNEAELFERVFIGLYDHDGVVVFFDVAKPPPRTGRPKPSSMLFLQQLLEEVVKTYDARNNPPVEWVSE